MGGDPKSAALAQEHAARQRVHQAQLAQQAQQRLAQQRLAHQRQVQQRQVQQRQAQQRQALQRQAQRLRVWQRTFAKRAARQVETELAIEERQARQRNYAATVAHEPLIAAPLKLGRLALRRRYMQAPCDVGDLERPLMPPRRSRIAGLHWSRAGRERRAAEAESAYQAAVKEYEQAEFDRVRRLSTAKLDHQRSQAEAADRLWAGYQAGDRDAVATYAMVVLSSRAPNRAGAPWQVRYEPADRRLVVDAAERNTDAAQALFDLFHALDDALVEVISFNGRAVTRQRWAAEPVGPRAAPQHHAAPR